MPTPEELIQSGALPGSVAPVPETVAPVVVARPLTDQEKKELEAEVLFDWDHIPSSKVRFKRNSDPEYAAALDRCASEGYAGTPFEAHIIYANAEDKVGTYHFELKEGSEPTPVVAPSPAVVVPLAPVVPEVIVSAPVVASTPEVVDPSDPFLKTSEGWEVRIDLEDGGGVQVFKGRTKTELSKKLVKAQFNATKELRRRNREREVLNDFDPSTLGLDKMSAPAPVVIGADELYTLTNELRDPATSRKAFQKLLAAEVSDPNSALGSRIRRADESAAFESSKEIAKSWVRNHSDFYNDPSGENIQTIYRFFVKHLLDVTEKNLDTVFGVLQSKGALLEAPIEDPEPVAPAVVAPVVPASVVPAPAAPTAASAPSSPASTAPAAQPAATRVRPGSVSTGMSPRQASVRPGASGATPVGLTAEEYRKLPTTEVKRRYNTDLAFRQGVDKLITEGKI